MLAVICR